MTIFIFSSKILGLLKTQLIVYYFGGGIDVDAFWSGYMIPNTLRELLAEGAFSATFVMVFTKILVHDGKEIAFKFANNIINIGLALTICVGLVLFLLSPIIVPIWHKEVTSLELTREIFVMLLPYLILLSSGAILMGLLNSQQKFYIPSLAPFVSNVVLLTVLVLVQEYLDIYGLVVAFLSGALAQLILQIPFAYRTGWKYKFLFNLKDKYVIQFFKWLIPIVLVMSMPRLFRVVSNIYATDLLEGANAALNYSWTLLQLPVSVFITAISIISLTNLSRFYEEKDWKNFRALMSMGIRVILLFAFPSMVGFLVLSDGLSSFLYRDIILLFSSSSGKINQTLIDNIDSALFYYSPSLLSISLAVIVIRAYQGIKVWKEPLIIGFCAFIIYYFIVKLFIALGLKPIPSIALGFVVASFCNCIALFTVFILRYVKKLESISILKSISKVILSSSVMGLVVLILKYFIEMPDTEFLRIVYTLFLALVGLIVYASVVLLLKEEEAHYILKKILYKVGIRR